MIPDTSRSPGTLLPSLDAPSQVGLVGYGGVGRRCLAVLLAAFTLLWASSALAQNFVVGLGTSDVVDDGIETEVFQVEIHSDPFRTLSWGSLAWFAVVETDTENDAYVGGGLAVTWDLNADWFVESSLAAGYYEPGDGGIDLGGNFQFRTLVGVGYRLTERSRISLAVNHLSNAGLEEMNPGRNNISLRYGWSF